MRVSRNESSERLPALSNAVSPLSGHDGRNDDYFSLRERRSETCVLVAVINIGYSLVCELFADYTSQRVNATRRCVGARVALSLTGDRSRNFAGDRSERMLNRG